MGVFFGNTADIISLPKGPSGEAVLGYAAGVVWNVVSS
jgi:hypothetical protein